MANQTNEQRYRTAEERVNAFMVHRSYKAALIKSIVNKFAHWLALEADEEKPENCPFCGKSCTAHKGIDMVRPHVSCDNDWCGYKSAEEPTIPEAIAAHNRVARAARVAESKKGE